MGGGRRERGGKGMERERGAGKGEGTGGRGIAKGAGAVKGNVRVGVNGEGKWGRKGGEREIGKRGKVDGA